MRYILKQTVREIFYSKPTKCDTCGCLRNTRSKVSPYFSDTCQNCLTEFYTTTARPSQPYDRNSDGQLSDRYYKESYAHGREYQNETILAIWLANKRDYGKRSKHKFASYDCNEPSLDEINECGKRELFVSSDGGKRSKCKI